MESESGVTRSIIDELRSWDIEVYETEDKSGVTQSIIDQHHSSYIQGDLMQSESCVT